MEIAATPDENLTVRQTATSPSARGNQPSGLTAALQRDSSDDFLSPKVQAMSTQRPSLGLPSESSDMSRFENGARPISMKGRPMDKNRRESLAQSLGMGMSWGGASVGSWIRDDMIMAGTSPFAFHQSPSYHSSSYLPKLEADFMRDFVCCGTMWKDLHALLTHYEETHAQQEPIESQTGAQHTVPDQRAALASNTRAQIQHEAQKRAAQEPQGGAVQPALSRSGYSNTLQTIPDMDAVEDMEMDDIDGNDETTPPSNMFTSLSSQNSPSTQFASTAQAQVPQLNTNLMQSHQAYRNSTPNTPTMNRNSAAFQGANISSTLNPNPMQQFQDLHNPYRDTPDSSAPGTPGELDESIMAGIDDMSMQGNAMFNGMNGFGNNFGFGVSNDMIDLCIDEPAKRLFQANTSGNSQQAIHQRLGSGQYGPNSEIAKRIREQQVAAGLPDTMNNLLPHEEPKPFRCPVIGCDKSYRNANGLKYHKTHGHQNQRLQENGDGTFSILDPDNNQPYPGTVGMEKEKPYKCEVCHKRYKNLNGLKYHKTHSPPCNPELVQQRAQQQQSQQGTTTIASPPPTSSSAMSSILPNQNMSMNLNNMNFNMLGGDQNL
ncbi:Transcriptional regulator of ribosomal biogenesis proteins [Lithohypha guttulata]|nr:Transcriptional regulator of ribosomal biogenesis proteins [Lithohypha guttulata]